MVKLEVGKKYERKDGEVVEIVYESKIDMEYRFVGVRENSTNFYIVYYNITGEDSNHHQVYDLVREHSIWLDIKRDTLVRVYTGFSPNNLRYFDRYEDGEVYCFSAGRTSYTNTVPSKAWHPTRVWLYKKEEDIKNNITEAKEVIKEAIFDSHPYKCTKYKRYRVFNICKED